MALQRFLRREPAKPAVATAEEPASDETGFPNWAISSLLEWLRPFFHGEGASFDQPKRNFLREAERNLRLRLDWRYGEQHAIESLLTEVEHDPELQVRLFDFAVRNIRIGYMPFACEDAALDLDQILRESGSVWCVGGDRRRLQYHLERRIDATSSDALSSLASDGTPDARHLAEARRWAFGQHPNPGKAYDEAVKAVEAVAIPAVLPNDPIATLGKAIGELRNDPTKWTCTFTRSTKDGKDPVEVVIAMLDMLWRNETERHAPVVPITQDQAESAVHVAIPLVQMFRSGALKKT
jgi:hypothetical protein